MRLSILIVSHEHELCLVRLLRTILPQTEEDDEILVLHNLPTDMPQPQNPRIRFLNRDRPYGLADNLNWMIGHAQGESILILNPDTRLPASMIAQLLENHNRRKGLLLGARSVGNQGLWPTIRQWPSPLEVIRERLLSPWLRKKRQEELLFGTATFWIQGSLYLGLREDFLQTPFDPSFLLYCEDVDFCWRWWEKGGKIEVLSEPVFHHDFQQASSRDFSFTLLHIMSFFRLFQKYPQLLFSSRGPTIRNSA